MTQKLTKEIIVPKDKAEFYRKHANLTGDESVEKGADRVTNYIEEVTFEDGYRVVIEFIIGEGDNPNWSEGSLFSPDEFEIQTSVAEDGNIFGEWFFWTGEPDVEYTVIVKEEDYDSKLELARKVFHEMKPSEVVEYTCTAINSLFENDVDGEYNLCYTTTRQAIKNFIIDTLIVNEIHNGFRDEVTGELIDNIESIKYGVIG